MICTLMGVRGILGGIAVTDTQRIAAREMIEAKDLGDRT